MLFVFDFARGWIYKLTTTHVPDTDQFFASFVPGRIAGPTLATPTSDDELVERAARNVMWKNAPVWSSSTCYQSLKSMYEKRSRAKADVTTAILACSQDCDRGDTWACMLFDDFAKPSVVGVVCRRDPDFCTSACRENASPLLRATMCSTPIR
ncbi:MAG: hypothetical protein ACKV2T_38735 [Kofleriaceae bacterium]